ncbi:MAG: carbohydrate kinase family protein [Promethearchaeota archaeon]
MPKPKFDVIGLGSCTMDIIFSVDDVMRMTLIGRNKIEKKYMAIEHSTKLNVKKVQFFPGGSAANITCDLSNIGLNSAYIGGIGNDSSGEKCLKNMKSHGVDVSAVKVFTEDSTATSIILMTPLEEKRDRSILAYKGANNLFAKEHIPEEMLRSTRCFVWTSLTSDNSIGAINKCIEIAKSSDALIAGAPSISIIKNRSDDTISLLKKSDIAGMNDEELEALTRTTDVREGMQKLFDLGLKIVNVTFGKEGQWLSDGETLVKTNPLKVFPKDTTGAGDATMSGIIYGILQGKSLEETARIAASLSTMEIESTGVRVGTPGTFLELEDFIHQHEINQESTKF